MNAAPKFGVNRAFAKAQVERRKVVTRALRYVAAEMASGAPAKQIADEVGISPDEVYQLRKAQRNPGLAVWYALKQRRPDLSPMVDRITSGEATSEQIQELIRFFQGAP